MATVSSPFVQQITTKCLSHFSYYVESNGEAVVIDPVRQFHQYLALAKGRKAKITAVVLTHLPEDHVAGHVELAEACNIQPGIGAKISEEAKKNEDRNIEYSFNALQDSQSIYFGNNALSVMETPGHSRESICFLLRGVNEANGRPSTDVAVFTGDTLLINDVGRTDIPMSWGSSVCGCTAEATAALRESLKTKLWTLSDDTKLYPGHLTGSVSTAFHSSPTATESTIGEERKTNSAFRMAGLATSALFCSRVLSGQFAAPPTYFTKMMAANRRRPQAFDAIVKKAQTPLTLADIDCMWGDSHCQKLPPGAAGAQRPLVLDTRNSEDFCKAHIPGSIFFGLEDGNLAPYLATSLPDITRPIIIVSEQDTNKVALVAERLASIGYECILGHMERGFWQWKDGNRVVASMRCVTVDELHTEALADPSASGPSPYIIDTRKPHEYRNLHLHNAVMLPLEHRTLGEIDCTQKVAYAYCRSGYRSVCYLSIAQALHGFNGECVNILGGFTAMTQSGKYDKLLTAQEDSSLSKL